MSRSNGDGVALFSLYWEEAPIPSPATAKPGPAVLFLTSLTCTIMRMTLTSGCLTTVRSWPRSQGCSTLYTTDGQGESVAQQSRQIVRARPRLPDSGAAKSSESMHGNQITRRLPCDRSISCSAVLSKSPTRAGPKANSTSCNMFCCSPSLPSSPAAIPIRSIVTFIKVHRRRLNAAFGLHWRRAPAHTSIRYILQGLDPQAVEQVFRQHAAGLCDAATDPTRRIIAIDGKTLRRSFDNFNDRKAAQVLHAFDVEAGLVLAHVDIAEKSNEIPAAQQLLGELKLAHSIVTLDAMHCQKKPSRPPRRRRLASSSN